MIQVTNKYNCCGCSACVQVCPKQCITFDEDEQGFRYPQVNQELCVDCKLCENVCFFLQEKKSRKPLHVYAAINPNEGIRMNSSSGGIFSLIAELVIAEGGVVFGARFNENWEVIHDYTETMEGLEVFRKSKYVQSMVGKTYKKAKRFLQQGRLVLYTGTPCQIGGLHMFLQKDYENLLTVDVVCHGVPSPLVWRTYLQEIVCSQKKIGEKMERLSDITDVSFRDKVKGWKKYSLLISGKIILEAQKNVSLSSMNIVQETFDKNVYMQVFLNNLCLRPSCFNCSAKSGKSGSDLTLADYWGIANSHPQWDDDKGTSLILVNSLKGEKIIKSMNLLKEETLYEDALRCNSSIEKSVSKTKYMLVFWEEFQKSKLENIPALLDKIKPSILGKIYGKIKHLI